MGMVAISREDYPNAAASHAGSESIDEWMKKKYAISQQTADANTMQADTQRIEADSLARQRNWEWNPDLESSKGVGGYRFLDLARQKNLDVSAIAHNNAGASKLGEEAEGLAIQNKLESELYGDTLNTARMELGNKRLVGMGTQQLAGQMINRKLMERNALTGENNPLIATWQDGNPVYENKAINPNDLDNLTAGGSDSLATNKEFTMLDRLEQTDKANKANPTGLKSSRTARNLLGLFGY